MTKSDRLRVYPSGEGLSWTGTTACGTRTDLRVRMAGMVRVVMMPATTLASVQGVRPSLAKAMGRQLLAFRILRLASHLDRGPRPRGRTDATADLAIHRLAAMETFCPYARYHTRQRV